MHAYSLQHYHHEQKKQSLGHRSDPELHGSCTNDGAQRIQGVARHFFTLSGDMIMSVRVCLDSVTVLVRGNSYFLCVNHGDQSKGRLKARACAGS